MNPSSLISKHSIALENGLCSLSNKTTFSFLNLFGGWEEMEEKEVILNHSISHPLTFEPRTCYDVSLLAPTGVHLR